MALTASTVSRALRTAGFPISQDRNRQGVRVSRGALRNSVCIAVDLDTPGRANRMADTLAEWLAEAGLEQGWTWKRNEGDSCLFRVEGPEAPAPAPRRAARLTPGQEAGKLSMELRNAGLALENAVRARTAPAQADITAARTALEALITLAGGDQ